MRQVLVKKRRIITEEVPAPVVSRGGVLVKVVNSCISAGTEISIVQGSGKPLIRRALEQPETVRRVLKMARGEGIVPTFIKVRGKLKAGTPIGYSVAGIALSIGEAVEGIKPGDRVAAAGPGMANHAEYVEVPRNLVMRIPDGLDFASASTVALGGIAMQGVRRAGPALGEFFVVFGTGAIGQLAVQMLSVSGARVVAVDLDQKRLDMCEEMGAELCLNSKNEDVLKSVKHHTNGHGADAVIFCATTEDSRVLSNAFAMCREKGRLVMVGVWGRELRREDMYGKELDFLVSTSYGPGRYDDRYEQYGLDYPYSYVRWTENRNMEEYLRLLATGKIQVRPLIQAVYSLDRVEQAFRSLENGDRPLMVLLDYGEDLSEDFSLPVHQPRKVENRISFRDVKGNRIRVGLIGAGGFAVGTHLPNLKKLKDKYEVRAICSRTGSTAQATALQFGARFSTTDYHELLSDPDIDLIMVCTRHNLHGQMVLNSLRAGKHTFVEKPLCTKTDELEAIKSFYDSKNGKANAMRPLLFVGFNRRFSRYAREVKKHTSQRINPLCIHYMMNAGYIPLDHWVHSEEGGGRITGEACHVIDLFSYLTESPIHAYTFAKLWPKTDSVSSSDNHVIVFEYEDGSLATLEYFAIGARDFSKERLEVHFDEKTIVVDDYKSIRGYGLHVADIKTSVPEKGQLEELRELAEYLRGDREGWPIELATQIETTEVALQIG